VAGIGVKDNTKYTGFAGSTQAGAWVSEEFKRVQRKPERIGIRSTDGCQSEKDSVPIGKLVVAPGPAALVARYFSTRPAPLTWLNNPRRSRGRNQPAKTLKARSGIKDLIG
jgi:hypothetical protein